MQTRKVYLQPSMRYVIRNLEQNDPSPSAQTAFALIIRLALFKEFHILVEKWIVMIVLLALIFECHA